MVTSERIRALELFATIYPAGRVTFTGGEALTSPDIFILLEKARKLGLGTQLYTNGILIRETNVQRIIDLVDVLQISLDGATAVVNDTIRGLGSFNRITQAIKLVNESKRRDSFLLRVAFTLTPSNALDIQQNLGSLLEDLLLKGNYKISIGAASKLGRAANNSQLYSNVEEMRAIEAQVIHSLAQQGRYKLPMFSFNRFQRTCGIGGAIGIAADGAIYPCTITDQPPLGNVRDPDALSVMHRVKDYIDSANIDKVEGCNRCAIRYFCGGICRITNLVRTGSYVRSACTPDYKESQIRTLIRRYDSFRLVAAVS
jgi:radical SAM protein with 4Fe4S-binding SPASM domain